MHYSSLKPEVELGLVRGWMALMGAGYMVPGDRAVMLKPFILLSPSAGGADNWGGVMRGEASKVFVPS